MAAYYSENDPFAAAWLRELIADGLIADGEVDERSIADVSANDVRGFTQCHFFAGIGGWSYALRLAGWADDRFVWTGSAPCQPFSAAGAQAGGHDPRDLWPVWFQLIAQCRPGVVFGEQVEAAIGHGWLDRLCDDLEAEGYAVGACGLPAASVGAFHIRQRLWFVAESEDQRYEWAGAAWRRRDGLADIGATGDVADADYVGRSGTLHKRGADDTAQGCATPRDCHISNVGHADQPGPQGRELSAQRARECAAGPTGVASTFWSDVIWLPCSDGKARPTQSVSIKVFDELPTELGYLCDPGAGRAWLSPLMTGAPNRVGRLRGYGNSVHTGVAAAFIAAYMDIT